MCIFCNYCAYCHNIPNFSITISESISEENDDDAVVTPLGGDDGDSDDDVVERGREMEGRCRSIWKIYSAKK